MMVVKSCLAGRNSNPPSALSMDYYRQALLFAKLDGD
jgi:hypothetical protein